MLSYAYHNLIKPGSVSCVQTCKTRVIVKKAMSSKLPFQHQDVLVDAFCIFLKVLTEFRKDALINDCASHTS